MLQDVLRPQNGSAICAVPERGWLIAAASGPRGALRDALERECRLRGHLPDLAASLRGSGSIRWGIWIDQYVLPLDRGGVPALREVTARAVFDFEPDDVLLYSETIYAANRQLEQFVGVPRRLLNQEEPHGYRHLGRKRPSALDHAANAKGAGPFVGRKEDLAFLDSRLLPLGRAQHTPAGLVADAGAGKTRLIREWRRRHPELRTLLAGFSLFGGEVADFAAELAELPSERPDVQAMIAAINTRITAERIEVLVLDDLHWADAEGELFVRQLLEALSSARLFVLLLSRPSRRTMLQALAPGAVRDLRPLPPPALDCLARGLCASEPVAAIAAARSRGNPLFVEQFAAWAAETRYQGKGDAPRTLHQVIAARIATLSEVRLAGIRKELRWSGTSGQQEIERQLQALEDETGLWLDRLETADYGDRSDVARHLIELERLDFEILMARMLASRARPRASRLREAIERLLVGSAESILADLKVRAATGDPSQRGNVRHEAERAGEALARHFNWALAAELFSLACTCAEPWQQPAITDRFKACARRKPGVEFDETTMPATPSVEEKPAVDAVRLPEVWAELGRRHCSARHFGRTAAAADAVNDHPLAAWARRKAAQANRP